MSAASAHDSSSAVVEEAVLAQAPIAADAPADRRVDLALARAVWQRNRDVFARLWTWLIIAAYTQLRLARPLAADLRRPWEPPAPPERLTPARVRRGFRHLRRTLPCPASAPKPTRPGPGRPPGRPNQQPAHRYDIHLATSGKTGTPKPNKKKPANPRPRRTG